ncbi:MAG: response regulator transcription factor [Candidatus Binataceae bacterium]
MTNRKRLVILVEDDPSVLRAVRRLILGAGFDVVAFDRPSAVLESVLPKSEACLLVDVHLPEMNGIELCRVLAASGCELPTVLITGATDEATHKLVRTMDVAAVLYKPFQREVLIAALGNALARKEQ